MRKPLLTITCYTYNHENFIRETINGFLLQKTNFPIEIIIHDDASTDNTPLIIDEFVQEHPSLISAIYQKENQYSKGIKVSSNLVRPISKGEYIALCEGDDFWTDPLKLQKQVDFLEANKDFAICHHNLNVVYEGINKDNHLSNSDQQKEVSTINDLANGNFIYTASCVYRNRLFDDYPDWFEKCPITDYPTHMLNAQFGKIKFIPDVMGVYRVHKDGLWEVKDTTHRSSKWVNMLSLIKDHFSPDINRILKSCQIRLLEELIECSKNEASECNKYSHMLLDLKPLYLVNFKYDQSKLQDQLTSQIQETSRLRKDLIEKIQVSAGIKEELVVLQDHLTNNLQKLSKARVDLSTKEIEISTIKSSRVYQLSQMLSSARLLFRPQLLFRKLKLQKILRSKQKLIQRSGYFDASFYLQQNPDVANQKISPVIHYIQYGGSENRNPSKKFDSKIYLKQNPDVEKSGINPLLHYLIYGKNEGRKASNVND